MWARRLRAAGSTLVGVRPRLHVRPAMGPAPGGTGPTRVQHAYQA